VGLILLSGFITHKKWHWGYFLGGLLFGIYNEFSFEFCWNYTNDLAPMLWLDVPLVVVMGWGANTLFSLSVSDRILEKIKSPKNWVQLLLDLGIFFIMSVMNEISMANSGYWSYNFPIQGELSIVFLGYFGLGLFLPAIGRRIQNILDPKSSN